MQSRTPTTVAVIAVAALSLLAACEKDSVPIETSSDGTISVSSPADSAGSRGHAMVRIVNAMIGGNNATVRLGDSIIFESVKPTSVSDYREVDASLSAFSVVAVDGAPAAESGHSLQDGNRYTMILVPENVSKNALRIIEDNVVPDSGKARIRVVHAAPGGPQLQARLAGSTELLFDDIEFTSQAGFKDVTPGVVTMELLAKDGPTVLLRIPQLDLKRGTSTTIVLIGASRLEFFKFVDTPLDATPKA